MHRFLTKWAGVAVVMAAAVGATFGPAEGWAAGVSGGGSCSGKAVTIQCAGCSRTVSVYAPANEGEPKTVSQGISRDVCSAWYNMCLPYWASPAVSCDI
jgi:hypothetical protein